MAENENLPDWLKQLRDQQMGPAPSQPDEPVADREAGYQHRLSI